MSALSDANKFQKRLMRLLAMVEKQSPLVELTQNSDMLLLDFEGVRKVRCPREILAVWIASEWVCLKLVAPDGRVISITESGKKKLRYPMSDNIGDQHRELVTDTINVAGGWQTVKRNINESPLSGLFRVGPKSKKTWLSPEEFSAGERLRSDFEYAQLAPRVAVSWDPTSNIRAKGGRRPDETMSERAMGARSRLTLAIDAVGPEFAGILLDICCFLKGIEEVERERNWPRRSAKLLLKAGLSSLSRHYAPERKSRHRGNVQHWGTTDYRPIMFSSD